VKEREREKEKHEEEAKRKRERKRNERKEQEGRENALAYEIKWRIYTVRSQYTYVRLTVNYTVNRRVLFDRRGKEDHARYPTRTKDESRAHRASVVEKGKEVGGKIQRRPSLWSAR